MTPEDLIVRYLGLFPKDNYNKESVGLLAGIVNTNKTGLISYAEFRAFEGLLCFPDALYKTAFHLFDTNGNGVISFGNRFILFFTSILQYSNRIVLDEFVDFMKKTDLHKRIPFNMNSGFTELYFGKNKKRSINYSEFSQFLHDFHEEYAIEAFRRFDKDGSGFITLYDFHDIMMSIKKHLLTKQVESHLIEASFSRRI